MTAWTSPKTWSAGAAVTAAELNAEVRDNLKNIDERLTVQGITSTSTVQPVLSARYGWSAYTETFDCNDGVDKAVQFAESDEEFKSIAGMHTDSAAARWFPGGGSYDFHVSAWVQFAANGTGRREVWLERSDGTEYNRLRIPTTGSAASTNIQCVADITLNAGQYLIMYIRQSSGSTLSCNARIQAHRIGA